MKFDRVFKAVLEHTLDPPYADGTVAQRVIGRAIEMEDGSLFIELTEQLNMSDLYDHGGVYELCLKPTDVQTWSKMYDDFMKAKYRESTERKQEGVPCDRCDVLKRPNGTHRCGTCHEMI